MSLKVWLPLNGDLRNLGASDLQFTNENTTNITIDNDGKIGKCYKRNSIQTEGRIIADKTLNLDGDLSMCCWAKVTGTVGDTANGLVSLHSHANNTGFGITVKQISTTDYRISCSTGNGSSRTFHSYYGTTNIKDVWHHLTLTYNNTLKQFKLWVDGKVEYTLNYTNASQAETLMLFEWSTTYNQVNYRPACSLNDVRIYDHCLSAAEVHEIAQGLILHYKLDSVKIKTGTNLVTGVTKGGRTTILTDGRIGVKTTGENADTYFTINLSESITNGTKYFLSCDASGIPNNGYWYFPLGTQNNSALPFRIYNGHNEYSFVANDISWGENRLFMDDNNRQYWDSQATFWNFELYKAPALEIEDSSGYNHNATLTNGSMTNDTARFLHSLTLDASTKAIGEAIFEAGVFIPEYTWAGWIKRNYTTASAKQIHANIANINLYTDFTPYISWTSGKTDGSTTGNGAAGGTKIATLNEWVHMAITYKSGIGKFYINGELIKTWDYTSSGVYIAAYENNALGNGFIGNLSDIRIYTTALLDNDIKLLYNMGMRVDNLQNLHTFEYKENTSNLFRSELIMPFAKTGYTEGNGNITTRNGSPAMDIRANIFYQNLENSTSGFLKGYFEANTSYVFDMWIDTDAVIYNGNNVAGGLRIIYTDDSFEHTFVFTGGNKGWQHKVYITPSNKTIDRIEVYYYVEQPVYCRLDSCICPLSNLKLYKTGIFEGTNLLEETNTKLIKNALIETNEVIEI